MAQARIGQLLTRILRPEYTVLRYRNIKSISVLTLKRHFFCGTRAANRPSNECQLLPPSKMTKKWLLSQSSSPLSRLWIHIKWPLTRNNRSMTMDDISAFASWLMMANFLWILLGTTTFGFGVMYSLDTLDKFWDSMKSRVFGWDIHKSAKNGNRSNDSNNNNSNDTEANEHSFIGEMAGSVLSQGLGLRLSFESGNVMPEFTEGMLKFKNVRVSLKSPEKTAKALFSATVSQLNLSLSFKKWYEGNGLIYNVEIFGMKAKVHRILELPDKDMGAADPVLPVVPTFNSMALSFSNYNDTHNMQNDLNEHIHLELESVSREKYISMFDRDYELTSVKIHDSSFELYENNDQVPFRITVFNCELPRLRGNRLLLDFFNASNVTGTVNNSMFTIHKHQTMANSGNAVRFKLDGIDMGSLSKASPHLKFNWLVSGKAEVVADIRFPDFDALETEKKAVAAPSAQFFEWIIDEVKELTQPNEASHSLQRSSPSSPRNDGGLFKGAISAIYETFSHPQEPKLSHPDSDYVIVNVTVKFRNLKAAIPPYLPMAMSASVPFVSLQNLRSLISYINSIDSDEPLVIKTTVIEKLSDLYNLDVISQTRAFDAIVSDIYEDFLRMIKLDEQRIMSERSQMWLHSLMSQLLLLGVGALA